MPTGEPDNANLPRWRRAGPPWLLTHDEILVEVQRQIPMDHPDRQLRRWIKQGLLPKPIRQAPRGAKTTGQRSLYPWWLIYVIFALWQAEERQATEEELQTIARQTTETWKGQSEFHLLADRPPETDADSIPPYLQEAIWAFAAQFASDPEHPIVQRAFLEFEMRQGPHTVRITIDPPALSPPIPLAGTAESVGGTSGTLADVSQREEWTAWVPTNRNSMDELITRDEIVDRVRQSGIHVTADDLRYWERQSVLPRAIRRRRGNATYALFPEWYVQLVIWIRAWQQQGMRLREIRPLLRVRAHALLTSDSAIVDGIGIVQRDT